MNPVVSLNQYTLLCVSRTQRRQEIYASACRTHLHTVVVVPCLKYLRRQEATLPSETKEARDLVLTSDWLSEAGMISNVRKSFQKVLLTSALMPTVSKKH